MQLYLVWFHIEYVIFNNVNSFILLKNNFKDFDSGFAILKSSKTTKINFQSIQKKYFKKFALIKISFN